MDDVTVIDMPKDGSFFADNNIDNMMVDGPSVMMDDDDAASATDKPMDNTQDVKDTARESKQKHNPNKKYHLVFKPNVSPISNRLRKKNKLQNRSVMT